MNRKLLLSLAGVLIATPAIQSIASAADEPTKDFETLDVTVSGRSVSAEYATRDTDGDGWTDWLEHLEGTDPRDPKSHPGAVQLEIIDRTVFVQSKNFPDRLMTIDGLDLPTTFDSAGALLATVTQLTGSTTLGKFRDRLDADVARLGANSVFNSIAADAAQQIGVKSPVGFGRVSGMNTSLIAEGEQRGEYNFATPNGFTRVLTDGNHTSITSVERTLDPGGNGLIVSKKQVDGVPVSMNITVYSGNVAISSTTYDAKGKPIAAVGPTTPPKSDPPKSDPPKTDPPKSTEATETSKPKDADTSAAPVTTVGGYSNPDADMFVLPTAAEVGERLAFLRDVHTRFGSLPDIPKEIVRNTPTVADPEEPACSSAQCAVFVIVMAPDLHGAPGGDPINPDNAHQGPPISMP